LVFQQDFSHITTASSLKYVPGCL